MPYRFVDYQCTAGAVFVDDSGSIAFSGEDFLRILGILLTSVIYLSTFYLIGLLIRQFHAVP